MNITPQIINAMLYRQIKPGQQYEGLIPKSEHTQHYFEEEGEYGDTYDTLNDMAIWAYKYAYQMKKVAPLLKGATLNETVDNIYKWLYSHFQYKMDETLLQNLNAPSQAWKDRFTGIDCKSYSILASTLLQCLSIPHAFRKIKQPGMMPDEWTHVYVIVPTQNNKYLVIDATTHDNKEVSKIEKYDYTMKLKHVGLASPAVAMARPFENYGGLACPGTECTCGQGLSGAYGFDMNSLYPIMPQSDIGLAGSFSWDSVKSIFSQPLSCIGGTSYDATRAKADIEGILTKLHGFIDNMNLAVQKGNMQDLAINVNKFIGIASWNASVVGTKRSEGWPSACTSENLKITHETYNFYRYTVVKALQIWLDEYFTSFPAGSKRYGRVSISGNVEEAYFGEWATWVGQDIVFDIPFFNYLPRMDKPVVKAFEVTKFIYESNTNIDAITPQSVLSSLTTIVSTVQQYTNTSGSTTNTTSGGTYNAQTGEVIDPPKKPTSKAGVGLLVGGVLIYAAYQVATSKPKLNEK